MVDTKQLKYEKALEYEIFVKEEYGFAMEVIQKANCIFDIWGHVWYFSEWCRGLNPSAMIYYFEPIKENYDKAVSRLCNSKNIELFNVWVASKTWEWVLLYNREKTMQSSKFSSFLNSSWEEEKVKFIWLFDALKFTASKTIDLVKIDIEWMEFEVLDSLSLEEWNLISNLIIEIHLLNNELEEEWKLLHQKIKQIFKSVEIIPSWYTDKIFLVRAYN